MFVRAGPSNARCTPRRRRAARGENRGCRFRPGEDWRLETGVFEDKVNREVYLVQRDLWAELAGEVYPVCLFLAVNRQGDVFLWHVKLPGSDGRIPNIPMVPLAVFRGM